MTEYEVVDWIKVARDRTAYFVYISLHERIGRRFENVEYHVISVDIDS